MTTTIAAPPVGHGRHRFGRAGLVPVAFFVKVAYRGLFASWRHPGKHRPYVAPARTGSSHSPVPAL